MRQVFQLPIPKIHPQQGPVFDNITTSAVQVLQTSYSFSHAVGAGGTNRILVVAVAMVTAGSVSSITYNSVGLTFIRSDTLATNTVELWQLVAPTTGPNTVEVTLSGALTSVAFAASYTGVDQTTPLDGHNGNTGASGTSTVSHTTTIYGDRLPTAAMRAPTLGTMFIASPAAIRSRVDDTNLDAFFGDFGLVTPAGAVTIIGSAGTNWVISTVALRVVGGTGPSTFLKDLIRSCGIIPWKR